MNYIITQEQNQNISNYLKQIFDIVFKINDLMYSPSEESDDSEWDFWFGKRSDDNLVFSWYDDSYEEGPLLIVYGGLGQELNDKFGNNWEEVFKEWFTENFGKPLQTIKY